MKTVAASAPGKVVLCGEYAVLDGAPAICVAVDRRAIVRVSPGSAEHHTAITPGYTTGITRFSTDGECFTWIGDGMRLPVVEAVWESGRFRPDRKLAIELDTRAFLDVDDGVKLGIGSSAAVTVALAAALDSMAGPVDDLQQLAMDAHRHLQGGRGSGVDVACSLHGGVIEYRMDQSVRRLQWPAGLVYAVVWSGIPAQTRTRLEQFNRSAPSSSRVALSSAAGRVASSWEVGDAKQIVKELKDYAATLRTFSIDHDLDIFDAGHAELADAVADELVYKPCGAGGGDIGVAIAQDAAAIAEFVELAATRNFKCLDLAVDPHGVERT